MSTSETSRYVRLRAELVVEVIEADAVTKAALGRIADDPDMPDGERAYTEDAVTDDPAEAIAYLIDPADLVGEVPGVELVQASWSSEQIDYDPDSPDWALGVDDEADGDEDEEEVGLG
ncbi:hypothetical protein AAW14_28095 [Streptomyces hygroscopicus]|uniref:hypothetical protein n=1 Tax=Streptomyces hygroscopicus TaxID=1912 RepID=UPI002240CA27|nr:hypothetical protein [Streptomyces hygroscopicus]MCW7945756.1 hypothetical protein [Streptomyces hygroscopicus]